jgi:hypothetical protein
MARATLSRGHRVIASGTGRIGRIEMRAHRRLHSGAYLLKVTVHGAAPDTQVILL